MPGEELAHRALLTAGQHLILAVFRIQRVRRCEGIVKSGVYLHLTSRQRHMIEEVSILKDIGQTVWVRPAECNDSHIAHMVMQDECSVGVVIAKTIPAASFIVCPRETRAYVSPRTCPTFVTACVRELANKAWCWSITRGDITAAKKF